MKNSNLVPAFLFGMAAGAILGILLAPQKGSELRAELKEDLTKWINSSLREPLNIQATEAAQGSEESVEEKSPEIVA